MELPDPPEGWRLKFLSANDPEAADQWTVHFWSKDAYVYGYGTTARYAFLDAIARITDGAVFVRLSGMTLKSAMVSSADVFAALNLPKKQIDRRF